MQRNQGLRNITTLANQRLKLIPRMPNEKIDVVKFSDSFKSYCVGVVDVVNSTQIIASLPKELATMYYWTFLTTMTKIAEEYGAKIVKNLGDSLLYYFPETSEDFIKINFVKPIECGLAMLEASELLNNMMHDEKLPKITYRVSTDYGPVLIAKFQNMLIDDIFGPTVNLCSKINSKALPNGMVLGGDLYEVVKSFEEYQCHEMSEFSAGLGHKYPVYSVTRTQNPNNSHQFS